MRWDSSNSLALAVWLKIAMFENDTQLAILTNTGYCASLVLYLIFYVSEYEQMRVFSNRLVRCSALNYCTCNFADPNPTKQPVLTLPHLTQRRAIIKRQLHANCNTRQHIPC